MNFSYATHGIFCLRTSTRELHVQHYVYCTHSDGVWRMNESINVDDATVLVPCVVVVPSASDPIVAVAALSRTIRGEWGRQVLVRL